MPRLSLAMLMGILRLFSGCLEITAGLSMIYFNRVETALKINAILAFIGPSIMIAVTALGLIGIAGKVPLSKMVLVFLGVVFIFVGLNK